MHAIIFIFVLYCCFLVDSFTYRFPVGRQSSNYLSKHEEVAVSEISVSETNDQSKAAIVPRLNADVKGLVKWVEKYNGSMSNVFIDQSGEGWILKSIQNFKKDDILVSIPKTICIFADPSKCVLPLLDNTQRLMNSLNKSQWRARLAVALLSERVRPNSPYRSYIRNLPFEFWGMPVFYSNSEFNLIQDLTIMSRTRDRCAFLSDFAENVLSPLHKTEMDPFSGHRADVNAFGWGFATAASRAIRNPTVVGEKCQVMIPVIDIASHSSNPNCEILDYGDSYVIKAISDITTNEELTVNYGPLGNDELLEDYGFTIDKNPYNQINLNCDNTLINTARCCMSQSSSLTYEENLSKSKNDQVEKLIGRGGNMIMDRWLNGWQVQWLNALDLRGPNANFTMSISGNNIDGIDGKLWAYLRILYTEKEQDLTKHGYDPFLLQSHGSVIDTFSESHVLTTIIGILAILVNIGGSDLTTDIFYLVNNVIPPDVNNVTKDKNKKLIEINSVDIVQQVKNMLKSIFNVPLPPSSSPTVRRITSSLSSDSNETNDATVSVETLVKASHSELDNDTKFKQSKKQNIAKSYAMGSFADDGSLITDTELLNKVGSGIKVILSANNDIDVSKYGNELSINVREILRYRIRKKRSMAQLIVKLKEFYDSLRSTSSVDDNIVKVLSTHDNKDDRITKIRELLDGDLKDDNVLQIAQKVSDKWEKLGLRL